MLQPIQNVASMTDPLRLFQFQVIVAEMKGGVLNAENFELQCQSYQFPGEKIDTTEIVVGGIHRKDASITRRDGQWTTEVIETWNGNVVKEFENWINISHNLATGIIRGASAYKTTALVNMLDGEKNVIRSRRLIGLYPSAVDALTYNPGSTDAAKVKVTWEYMGWEPVK